MSDDTDFTDQLFYSADVTVEHDGCTSEAGNQFVTEEVPNVECNPSALALVHIAKVDRSDPQFPVNMRIDREVDGVPVTLNCNLESVQNAWSDPGCCEGSYRLCYAAEVEFG